MRGNKKPAADVGGEPRSTAGRRRDCSRPTLRARWKR